MSTKKPGWATAVTGTALVLAPIAHRLADTCGIPGQTVCEATPPHPDDGHDDLLSLITRPATATAMASGVPQVGPVPPMVNNSATMAQFAAIAEQQQRYGLFDMQMARKKVLTAAHLAVLRHGGRGGHM